MEGTVVEETVMEEIVMTKRLEALEAYCSRGLFEAHCAPEAYLEYSAPEGLQFTAVVNHCARLVSIKKYAQVSKVYQ